MASTLTLTPDLTSAVAQELNDRNPFYVSVDGLALPVVSYDEAYAESIYSEGGRRSRSRAQNPEGKVNLLVTSGLSASTLRTRLGELQQTVEACRVYGGTLAYTPADGTAVTYDLESISLSSFDTSQLQFGRAPLELSVTTRPYGRLAPLAITTNATSTDPIQTVSLADIPGSAPALVTLTVTDKATQARDHLEAGIDNDWDGSAAALIDSASFSVSGMAGSATTRTGAYSSSGVIRATLGPDPLGICFKAGLGHRGSHRAKLRVYATGTGPIYVRVAYRVASGAWTYNAWRQVRGLNTFYEIDCGLVKGSDAGTLSVRVEARSALATFADTIDVDYLILMPASRWAKVKGRADTTVVTYAARDQFNQSAGYLDAPKTADVGGNWAEANRTGANGFAVETTGHTAQRAIPSDSSIYDGGCYAYVGSAIAACRVEGTVRMSAQPTGQTLRTHAYGLLARYTNANSWAAWVLCDGSKAGLTDVYPDTSIYGHQLALLAKTSAGSVVTVAQTDLSAYYGVTGYNYSMAVEIDANGAYRCYWQGMLALSGSYGEFVTGGALDDGKVGIFDVQTTSASITRNYDNFRSSGLSAATDYQHVVDADGAVIIDHESVRRSDGTRPPEFEGSYLTVPPAGREDRTHLLAVKMRRNDVDVTTDDNIADNQRLDVTVTPRVVLL